jgi:hypothetical protein
MLLSVPLLQVRSFCSPLVPIIRLFLLWPCMLKGNPIPLLSTFCSVAAPHSSCNPVAAGCPMHPHSSCMYSNNICTSSPVVSPHLKCPSRYCSLLLPCSAARCVRPRPPYRFVPNTTFLGAYLAIPILGGMAFTTGLCISSHSSFVVIVAGTPYPKLGI